MQKCDEIYVHEGLDRIDGILSIIEDRLGHVSSDVHPSIYDEKAKELLNTATKALAELYQHLGNWENAQYET